ncbi:MAG: sulfotransferase [Pseudomonadota bacterium]
MSAPGGSGDVATLFELSREGRFAEVAERATVLAAAYPRDVRVHALRAAACLELGDVAEATRSYRRALVLAPHMAKLHNGLGTAHLRAMRLDAARESFAAAVNRDPGFAPARFNLGIVAEYLQRWDEATEHYRRVLDSAPGHTGAHTALANALSELGDFDGALEALDALLRRAPDHVPGHRHRLALLEQSRGGAALPAAIAEAERALGEHPLVLLYRAVAGQQEAPERARQRLEAITFDTRDPAGAHDERQRLAHLTRLCDSLGDTEAALQHAADANALSQRLCAARGIRKETFLRFVDNRRRQFAALPAGRPAPDDHETAPGDEAAPVFVVGFPRSGTTLLDAVLRGHPELTVVEESDAVAAMVSAMSGASDERLEARRPLSLREWRRLRDTYYEALARRAAVDPAAGRVVDRFALNLVYAGEIHRVFPGSRFVLMLRHPADCVLSCYLQTFRDSSANASFHDLEDAARLYDRVFDLWRVYCEHLPLDVVTVRYEELVDDLPGVSRRLVDALGVRWHPSMLDFQRTARERDWIRTASYAQVTRPLYDDARGRWRRYRKVLEPVFDTLRPWIERFGYET